MRVHNPIGLQVIFYIAVVAFPLLSGYMFYLLYETYLEFEAININAITFAFCGVATGYFSYIGIILSKFIAAEVNFDEQQFTICRKNSQQTYQWHEIGSIKHYPSSQILRLYDQSGNTIYVVDYVTPGFTQFAEKVHTAVDN